MIRPCAFRPAFLRSGTRSDFSGSVRVISSKVETVIHRRPGEVGFLLTSDISSQAERWLLLARAPLQSTVLKVGHHGSATSTTLEFLDRVRPMAAVISAGADNPFGHPAPEVVGRLEAYVGENVFCTAWHGTVELVTDGEKLSLKRERER